MDDVARIGTAMLIAISVGIAVPFVAARVALGRVEIARDRISFSRPADPVLTVPRGVTTTASGVTVGGARVGADDRSSNACFTMISDTCSAESRAGARNG